MSNYDYEYSQAGQKSGGSVLPWILLTFVTVGAGVGMYFFNMQKDQAMVAVEKMKADYDTIRKAAAASKQASQDLERQLADMKTERDNFETAKNDANRKVDDLTQQIALAKLTPEKGSKGGKGLKAGNRKIVVVHGHHR